MSATTPVLVLASTSPYRAALLGRLGLPFERAAPDVPEAPLPGEDGHALAIRLAREKAAAVGDAWPDALVIGGDQVATTDGRLVGKPGHREAAIEQLRASSGREVVFHTAVCLLRTRDGAASTHVDVTRVGFRQLDDTEIRAYVAREQPYDCAGSFKAEALGVALFEYVRSEDPTGLVGLPLIWLSAALARAGMPPLAAATAPQ